MLVKSGKVLRHIDQLIKQIRFKLGAVSVQIGARMEPESYFHPITSSTTSGTDRCRLGAVSVQTRCSDGTRELFPSNYVLHYFRCRSVQTRCRLGARMEPESYFHSITSSTISGSDRCRLGSHSSVLCSTLQLCTKYVTLLDVNLQYVTFKDSTADSVVNSWNRRSLRSAHDSRFFRTGSLVASPTIKV